MSNHKSRIYVDIHVIQSLPPSCVNRDDTGSPKTAMYGGVRRARVSSQAWKKAVRDEFKRNLDPLKLAQRTKDVIGFIVEQIPDYEDKITLADASREIINIASFNASKPIIPDISYKGIKKMLKDAAKEWRKNEDADRERQLIDELRHALVQFDLNDKAFEKIDSVFSALDKVIKQKTDDKDRKAMEQRIEAALLKAPFAENLLDTTSDALFFIGRQEAINIAALAVDYIKTGTKPKKEQVQEALNYYKECGTMRSYAVEVALFGRMVAKAPSLNAEASCQVAHAISTHKIENEYDFFTAVDDRSSADNVGAGMIGTVEFNSSTMYRYATIAVHDLIKQLGGAENAAEAVRAFVVAFALSMPNGKQNTFANWTPPYAVMVAIRRDQPVNLVDAFEKPIKAGEEGYLGKSAQRLAEHAGYVYENFFKEPEKTFIVAVGNEFAKLNQENIELNDEMKKPSKFDVLLEKVEQTVSNLLAEDGVPS